MKCWNGEKIKPSRDSSCVTFKLNVLCGELKWKLCTTHILRGFAVEWSDGEDEEDEGEEMRGQMKC